jgi:ribose 1,5-bisphosphokinase PhnN
MHLGRNQWLWLHLYMCGQLIATRYAVPQVKLTNWVAFGLVALVYASRARVLTWRTLDYVWGTYLVLLAVAVSVLRLRITE